MAEAAQRMMSTLSQAQKHWRLSQAASQPGSRSDGSVIDPQWAVRFVGPVSQDTTAELLRSLWTVETPYLRMDGLVHINVPHPGGGTPAASLMLYENGDLERGVIQTSLVERMREHHVQWALTSGLSSEATSHARNCSVAVALDANLPVDVLRSALALARDKGQLAFLEPTSASKSTRLVQALLALPASHHARAETGQARVEEGAKPHISSVMGETIFFPNLLELKSMIAYTQSVAPHVLAQVYEPVQQIRPDEHLSSLLRDDRLIDQSGGAQALPELLAFTALFGTVVLTLGKQGVLMVLPPRCASALQRTLPDLGKASSWRITNSSASGTDQWLLVHVPPPSLAGKVVSTTGAGDTLTGSMLALLSAASTQETRASRRHRHGYSQPTSAMPPWEHLRATHAILTLAQAAAGQSLVSPRAVGEIERLAFSPELQDAWRAFFE